MKTPQGRERRIDPNFLRRTDFTTFSGNEKFLLNLVRYQGPISRADMARQTDLAMQSVVRLVDALIERGVLQGGEKLNKGRGQPSLLIHLVPDAAFAFGVSVMTDAVSVVLMDLTGRTRAAALHALDTTSRARVLAHVEAVIADLIATAGVSRERVFGVGVATTGYFIGAAALNPPADMGDWALPDLEEALAEALDLPVWLENDGNAGAAGESLFGAGQRHRSFAYLHVARGLGGGVVQDGRLVRGFRGNAGEFTGILPPSERPNRPTMALLLELVRAEGVAVDSITELVRSFDPAWPGVAAWLDRTQPAATAIISAIAAVLDPEVIVIGGLTPRPLAAMMAERLDYYAAPLRGRERPFPPILPAEAQGDAAALGAAAIPFKEHFFG